MFTIRSIFTTAISTGAVLACSAVADVDSTVTVEKGSLATAEVTITIDSLFGNESHTDTITVGVSGGGELVLAPNSPPFDAVEITDMTFALEDGDLYYCFFDVPIFGCQAVDVSVQNLEVSLQAAVSTAIDSEGRANFVDAPWAMDLSYQIKSSIFGSAGTVTELADATFGTNIVAAGGNLDCTNMTLDTIVGYIPEDELPVGVYEVALTTNITLSEAGLSGTYEEGVPGDLNGDNIINGADLGLMLNYFGTDNPLADLNGDFLVDGGDLGQLLSYWTL